jgi:MFS family permease
VLGGFFAEHLHWTLIFWINLPLGLLAFLMTNGLLRKLPRHERPHRLDFLGATIMAGATVTLMLVFSWGGHFYPWASIEVAGLFGVSALLWALFAVRLRTAPEPLIPAEVLGNPVVGAGTMAACFGMGVFIGLTAYFPIYLESFYSLTASQSGLALIPFMVGTVTGATISGRIMATVPHYKRLPLAGLSVAVAGLVAMALAPHGLPLPAFEIFLAAISVGIGSTLPVTTVAIQNAVMPHQMGTATGTMNFFRSLGGALIVAAFGAIVFSQLPQLLVNNVTPGILQLSLALDRASVAIAFRFVFAAAAFGLTLALASLAAMPERPLKTHIHVDSSSGVD